MKVGCRKLRCTILRLTHFHLNSVIICHAEGHDVVTVRKLDVLHSSGFPVARGNLTVSGGFFC